MKLPKDIVQAMFDDGWKQIPCCVSDIKENPVNLLSTDLLIRIHLGNFPYYCTNDKWKYVNPFDPKTGKIIVDYVDGKIITEIEDD